MSEFSTGASLVVDVDEASLRQTREIIERRVGSVSVDVSADTPAQSGGYGERQSRDQAFARRLQNQTIDAVRSVADRVRTIGALGETRNDLLRQLADQAATSGSGDEPAGGPPAPVPRGGDVPSSIPVTLDAPLPLPVETGPVTPSRTQSADIVDVTVSQSGGGQPSPLPGATALPELASVQNDTLALLDDGNESTIALLDHTQDNLDLNETRNDLLRQLLDATNKGNLTRARGGGGGLGGFGMIGGLAIAGAGVGLANLITNIKPSEVISGTLDVADDLISSAMPASALVTGSVTAASLISGTIGAGDLVRGIVDPRSFIGSAVSVGALLTGASVGSLLTSVSVGSLLTSSSVGSLLTSVSVGTLLTTASVGTLLSSVAIGTLVTTSSIGSLLTSVSVGSLLTPVGIGTLLTAVSVGGLLTAVSVGSLLTSISATDIITAVPLSKLVDKPADGGAGSDDGGTIDPKTIGLIGLLGAGGALLADTASGAASAADRATGSAGGGGFGMPSLPVLFGSRSESGRGFVDGLFDDLLGDGDDNRQRTSTQQAALTSTQNTASFSGGLAAKQPAGPDVTVEHKPTYELREGTIRELGRQQQKDLKEFDRRLTELERTFQRGP